MGEQIIKNGKLVAAPVTDITKLSDGQKVRLKAIVDKSEAGKDLTGEDAAELIALRRAAHG